MATHVETLSVTVRNSQGTRAARKMRSAGALPAILYGHGEPPVSLAVPSDGMAAALRHGTRVVKLTGGVTADALIREVQWDAMGVTLLHIDFSRIEAGERVHATIPLELRGDAPGTHEGGTVHLLIHELELDCSVTDLPELIHVNVNHLHLGQTIHAEDLKLPEGSKLIHGNVPVATCELVRDVSDEAGVTAAGEPEVIGRKAQEDEE